MKIYEIELRSKIETSPIWIKTDGKIIIPEDSCLSNLKEIEILENSSGIDLIIEENIS